MKGGDAQLSPAVWSAALDPILGRCALMRLKARRELGVRHERHRLRPLLCRQSRETRCLPEGERRRLEVG